MPAYGWLYRSKSMNESILRKRKFFRTLISQRQLVIMAVPILLYVILFTYVPLWGWTMAFQNYRPGKTFAQQSWVGLQWFNLLFSDDAFVRVMRNTLAMSIINIILGFSCAIILALLLNEIKRMFFKRVVQTITYLPHFLSWVIVSGLVATTLASDGIVNKLLMVSGIIKEPVLYMGVPEYFWGIVGVTNVWKEVGWNSIIYLAAIASIDPCLYEAAEIDGCNRFQRMWHITLPGLKPTIVVLLILSIGRILDQGFELQYLLGNGLVQDFSQTIDIYVIRYGMELGNYSLATAAGMFKSIICIILLMSANEVAKRLGEERLI
jgi:putative aldouronate transport system permease protein